MFPLLTHQSLPDVDRSSQSARAQVTYPPNYFSPYHLGPPQTGPSNEPHTLDLHTLPLILLGPTHVVMIGTGYSSTTLWSGYGGEGELSLAGQTGPSPLISPSAVELATPIKQMIKKRSCDNHIAKKYRHVPGSQHHLDTNEYQGARVQESCWTAQNRPKTFVNFRPWGCVASVRRLGGLGASDDFTE